ncbi:MAG: GIY-YIG nuclease family protein [Candidatus Magasanikbacteria bacterium]
MFRFDSKKFPDKPGIYLFYNSQRELIYVGKATSLKDRVSSYFSNSRNKSFRPIELLIHEVKQITYKETDSVLEAIILEGEYIKKFQPKYNVDWKDDKSWNYIVVTKDEYTQVKTIRQHEFDNFKFQISNFKFSFGPYPGLKTREMMKILHRLFYISTCKPCQPGKPCRPCLYYEMGQCLGVCTGEISPKDYQKKVISPLVMFLRGNKKGVIRQLEKQMEKESKKENFEEAGRLKIQIEHLRKIQDIALLNSSFISDQGSVIRDHQSQINRIEGYDISNLGTTGKVGSMVVFDAHGPVKSEYRKFKIKNVEGQSDVDCLREVLVRRLRHGEWKLPDIFLIDGGKPQVNLLINILKDHKIKRSVIGIAKGPERKRNDIIFGDEERSFIHWVNKNQELLIQVRDEAHRFAISYQKTLRRIRH